MKRDPLRTRHSRLASRSNRSSHRAQPSPRHHQCRSSSHTGSATIAIVFSLSGAVAPCRTSSLRVVRKRKPARGTPPPSAGRAGVVARSRWNDVRALSRPGNGEAARAACRKIMPVHGGSPGPLLDRLSLRRVVLRMTRSRSCPRDVVGDEPVPIHTRSMLGG